MTSIPYDVKIGKRIISTGRFYKAICESTRYTEVAENLGLNPTVRTTINAIKKNINDLEFDTSHFKYKYTKSEHYDKAIEEKIKEFNIYPINLVYYNSFKDSFIKHQYWINCKVNIGAFLEYLQNKDFAIITVDDIESFLKQYKTGSEATKNNARSHIRAMMIYLVKNNINNSVDRVNRNMLIWLISK
jgi:predicted nucleotide-binding protein (sugar kinase/HSP70/actin superfamily)